MSANLFYTWTCPSCGHVNRYRLEPEINSLPTNKKVVVSCDSDDGGCEKETAVFIFIEVRTEAYSLSR
jgi:hypothetical protein